MNIGKLLIALAAPSFLAATAAPAHAGNALDLSAAMACVVDKWDETEPDKGRKLVDYAGRCVIIPDDRAAQKYTEDCAGNYEFLADGTWKSGGTCTAAFKGDDKLFLTWQEGSHLPDYVYEYTSGSGRFEGAKGGGTYKVDELTKTLYGGRKTGKLQLP